MSAIFNQGEFSFGRRDESDDDDDESKDLEDENEENTIVEGNTTISAPGGIAMKSGQFSGGVFNFGGAVKKKAKGNDKDKQKDEGKSKSKSTDKDKDKFEGKSTGKHKRDAEHKKVATRVKHGMTITAEGVRVDGELAIPAVSASIKEKEKEKAKVDHKKACSFCSIEEGRFTTDCCKEKLCKTCVTVPRARCIFCSANWA